MAWFLPIRAFSRAMGRRKLREFVQRLPTSTNLAFMVREKHLNYYLCQGHGGISFGMIPMLIIEIGYSPVVI